MLSFCAMALIRLIIHPNEEEEQRFELEAECATVGCADDNDIRLEIPTLSPHHFKLERRGDKWFLVDLHSKQGTFLNEDRVTDTPIERGTVFKAGDCYNLFDAVDADEPGFTDAVEEFDAAQVPAISGAQTGIAVAARPCLRCGQPVPAGSIFCPSCGADQRAGYAPSPYVSPVETPMAPGAGLMPLVAFILSIFGPLLLIGWLIGIILGFVSLSIIRRRGGHASDVRRAHLAIYIGFAWFVLLGAGTGWWLYSSRADRRIRRNETRVMEQLRDVAVAQNYLKLSLALDRDGNGVSEYGSLVDLVSNGYGHVHESLATDARLYDYQFAMLRADESDFCCAAEPLRKGFSGTRTFLIRGDGFVCGEQFGKGAQLSAASVVKRMDRTSAVDDRADMTVRDLHKAAAQALRSKEYEKAQQIVKMTRERFPTAEGVAKLDAIEEKSNPFVVEIRARELAAQASNALARGQVLRAIETYQTIRDTYSTYSGIEEIDQQLRMLRDRHAQKNEQHAEEMLKEANAQCLRLAFDKAEAGYRTVINRYKGTSAAKEAERRLAVLAEQKKEQVAKKVMQDALSLNLETEYEDIYSRIEELRRAFGGSSVVSQAADRLAALELQCRARIHAATASRAFASTDVSRALLCYQNAAKLDAAYVPTFATNYAHALLHGVSNALAASDYHTALSHADTYRSLRIAAGSLPADRIDQVRLSLAELSVKAGDYSNAVSLIQACGDRLNSDVQMCFLAGKIYLESGDAERAARLFQQCYTQDTYAAEARPLLIAGAARAAEDEEAELIRTIAKDPEWLTLARTFSIVIPGITNTGATSTWQNMCVTLCDDVEMTYELLTYSGSEADLFLEKQKARSELDAALRKLQKTLKASTRRRRAAARAAKAAAEWWDVCLDIATNFPAASTAQDAQECVDDIARKQKLAFITAEYMERAGLSDISTKTRLLDYLSSLVGRLERRLPLRNVLADVKKYLDDQKTTKLSRKALSATAELASISVEPKRLGDVFSHLRTDSAAE